MSGKSARESRQEALDKIRQEQKSKERKGRLGWILGISIPIIALVVITVLVFVNSNQSSGLKEVPPSAAGMGQPFVLNPDAPEGVPVLDIYEDFQCPFCATFENALGETISGAASTNQARVQINLMNFLDNSLGNDSSTRAIRAAAAADEQGKFEEFHRLVYANQPEQEGKGWTNDELESYAKEAGVTDMAAWNASFKSDKWDAYIESMMKASNEAGVTGTPTIMVDGEVVTDKITDAPSLLALLVK